MKIKIENNIKRQCIRVLLALLIALMIDYCVLKKPDFLLPFAAFFVMLTTPGNAFYQGFIRFILLLVIVLFFTAFSSSISEMHEHLYALGIGGVLGIAVNMLILPDRADVIFREALIPVLNAYANYFRAIVLLLFFNSASKASKAKIEVEKVLRDLPVWVFATGFDVSMQKGHRYFLIKISEVGEILFAMHHLARFSYEKPLLLKIQKPFLRCTKKVETFFWGIIDVLALKKNPKPIEDFSNDIRKIEKNFKKVVSLSPELMDVEKEYVYLIEFIYTLKELHDILLKLAMALR